MSSLSLPTARAGITSRVNSSLTDVVYGVAAVNAPSSISYRLVMIDLLTTIDDRFVYDQVDGHVRYVCMEFVYYNLTLASQSRLGASTFVKMMQRAFRNGVL
ncbi:hypothetical protein DTO207G8_7816 [Paecilomyces variotii]|nr:hypothetical protein DTO207G8_7816 [Paecilomyces variotii]